MRERVGELVGARARAMWVMTFHSSCARMLRSDADKLGYTRGFTIYDDADSVRLVKRCVEELGVDPKRYPPRGIKRQISDAKNQLLDAEAYRLKVDSYFEQTAADVYERYEQQIHSMNAMDFDDLLFRCVNLFELFPEVLDRYRRSFQHVLVDEYQDTNHAQYRWLRLLADEHRNLAVVGDDAQSIYAFRGADIRNVLGFEDDFPDATTIKLEQNYRSTQTILDAANAIIANNRSQKPKHLWTEEGQGDPIHLRELEDEHAEARFVAGEIERHVEGGGSRDDVAVFYRANAQSRVLEDTLVRYGVGYQVIGGTRFYERAEIKDALAYLTLLVNPHDVVSFGRIVNSPRRGIGDTSQARLTSHANTIGEPIFDVALRPEEVPGLGAAAVKAVGRFMDTMEKLRDGAEGSSVGDLLQETLERLGLRGRAGGRAHDRVAGPAGEPGGAGGRGARVRRLRGRAVGGGVPAAGRSLLRAGQPAGRRGHRDAHDPPQRQGPGVRRGVHDRLRGRRVPAQPLDRGGRHRGRAPPLLRGRHPGPPPALRDPCAHPGALRRPRLERAQPLPRRDPGRAHRCPRAALRALAGRHLGDRCRALRRRPSGRSRGRRPRSPSATT